MTISFKMKKLRYISEVIQLICGNITFFLMSLLVKEWILNHFPAYEYFREMKHFLSEVGKSQAMGRWDIITQNSELL